MAYSLAGCRLNSEFVNCTVVTNPSHTASPTLMPYNGVLTVAMAMIFPRTAAETKLATSDSMYDGPALFCISASFALSSGSYPIRIVQGRANSHGEYHTNPTTIVDNALTNTAHRFTP